MLDQFEQPPLVLEAYGGYGVLYRHCFEGRVAGGAVIEKDAVKAERLAVQRPDWVVVQGDSERLVGAGFMTDWPFGLLDADAWGSPLDVVEGFLSGKREYRLPLWIVATDGLGINLKISGGANVLDPMVEIYGLDYVRHHYDVVLYELLTEYAKKAGLRPAFWKYYTCGHAGQMAHWAVRLEH